MASEAFSIWSGPAPSRQVTEASPALSVTASLSPDGPAAGNDAEIDPLPGERVLVVVQQTDNDRIGQIGRSRLPDWLCPDTSTNVQRTGIFRDRRRGCSLPTVPQASSTRMMSMP